MSKDKINIRRKSTKQFEEYVQIFNINRVSKNKAKAVFDG